jgi:proline iminopeptidase
MKKAGQKSRPPDQPIPLMLTSSTSGALWTRRTSDQPVKRRHSEGTAPGHDDVELHYRVSGNGPVLVAHPGGPGTSSAFFGDLAGLDDVATIVWFDPRGTGGSTEPADSAAYSLDHYASDVDALRTHLGLERMGLLGFSHGGMVAIRYAANHSDRLTHLVLLDTAPLIDEATLARVSAAMDRRQGEPWYEEVRRRLDAAEKPDRTDEEATADLVAILPMYFHRWDDVALRFVDSLDGATFHARVTPTWNTEFPSLDLRPELARITAPTLVVVGEDDFICDVESARLMTDGIAGARLEVIAKAGHFPWVEQPAVFRRMLDSFLAAP